MGTLDLLFNNAGICLHKEALYCTPDDWLKVVNVNLNGIFFMAQAFGKYLVSHHKTGNIVNTASMSGTIVNLSLIHICWKKLRLLNFVESATTIKCLVDSRTAENVPASIIL